MPTESPSRQGSPAPPLKTHRGMHGIPMASLPGPHSAWKRTLGSVPSLNSLEVALHTKSAASVKVTGNKWLSSSQAASARAACESRALCSVELLGLSAPSRVHGTAMPTGVGHWEVQEARKEARGLGAARLSHAAAR